MILKDATVPARQPSLGARDGIPRSAADSARAGSRGHWAVAQYCRYHAAGRSVSAARGISRPAVVLLAARPRPRASSSRRALTRQPDRADPAQPAAGRRRRPIHIASFPLAGR